MLRDTKIPDERTPLNDEKTPRQTKSPRPFPGGSPVEKAEKPPICLFSLQLCGIFQKM
jgi:hypothetical protein